MPGVTTYLDTPVLPIAAFASPANFPVDAEFPDGTPVVSRVDGNGVGPWVANVGDTITITSLGTAVSVKNPNFGQAGQPQMITRDYGFGAQGAGSSVTIDGNPANIVSGIRPASWFNAPNSGQLVVTRDNGGVPGKSSVVGIYVTVGGTEGINVFRAGGSIQAAIDAAPAGSLIIVGPGSYNEMVILYKNIRLQGAGAGVTNINAFKVPAEKAADLAAESRRPARWPAASAFCDGQAAGLNTFANEYGPGIIVLGTSNLAMNNARIDGFRISGADQGGAILVNGYTQNMLISNNQISGNQGLFGGGIRVGHPELIFQPPGGSRSMSTPRTTASSSGTTTSPRTAACRAPAAVSPSTPVPTATPFATTSSSATSPPATAAASAISASSNGTIEGNTILFNQSFDQGLVVAGGGVLVAGLPALGTPVGPGSGTVTVQNNRIQGNMAGAGDGGGIAVRSTNQDVVTITNNVIVNNVTGLAGGGISFRTRPT